MAQAFLQQNPHRMMDVLQVFAEKQTQIAMAAEKTKRLAQEQDRLTKEHAQEQERKAKEHAQEQDRLAREFAAAEQTKQHAREHPLPQEVEERKVCPHRPANPPRPSYTPRSCSSSARRRPSVNASAPRPQPLPQRSGSARPRRWQRSAIGTGAKIVQDEGRSVGP